MLKKLTVLMIQISNNMITDKTKLQTKEKNYCELLFLSKKNVVKKIKINYNVHSNHLKIQFQKQNLKKK